MHILLFHDSKLPPPHYGGIERIVVTLAEEYTRLGHNVSVLCRAGSSLKGCNTIALPSGWKGGDIEKLIPHEIDFIHSHQPLETAPKRPYLVTIHGNGHENEKYFANTNFLSRSHARNHNSDIFVFNGVDPKRYTFVEDKDDYFIFLAKTTWRVKNLKTAVAWAKDLKLRLKIIGGNGISRGGVEYLGFVDDAVKNKTLGGARALIYPTNWDEPCAGAPLEALACGTPVISTRNGCMPEMISDGKTGFICESYKDLTSAATKITEIKPSACREAVEAYFSVERMAGDYLKLFQKILTPCRDFKNFKFVQSDLLDLDATKKACNAIDRVWHLAANSDISSGGKTTDIDLKIGTIATYNVLEAMRHSQVREIVFSSTSAIYGEAEVKPTPESYGPLLPISFYGASKLACEALATAFSHNYDFKVWIYRFANIVGSHTTHGAIHDFIKKLKTNPSSLEILGDGKQAKSYLHVKDCVEGMIFGTEKSDHSVNLFNLASRGVCSVDQIADFVITGMKLNSKKVFTGGARGWKGDVSQVNLDGSKFQKLGFTPTLESPQAVKKAIEDILADSHLGIST
jgi:UDP-glucose 4-epimerase